MGLVESSIPTQAGDNSNRDVFVAVVSVKKFVYGNSEMFLYQIRVRTLRLEWTFMRRFSDIVWLHRCLRVDVPGFMGKYSRPRKKVFGASNPTFIAERAVQTEKYLQALADDPVVWNALKCREFFEISGLSLEAFYGRKGKEGYLRKCSGGYHTGFSRRTGDVFNTWRKRWIVLTDSQILYFKNHESVEPLGSLQVDPGLRSSPVGRYVRIENMTRQLVLICPSEREALEWNEAIGSFYKDKVRTQPQPFGAWFPPRPRTDVRVYTTGKNMMAAVCMALLTAQTEIYIAGWQLNPDVHLTRPPLPPLRLDQILRYKAASGVKIFIILFKEVEMAMTNASAKAKQMLRNLSRSGNVYVMRHPNKFVGGSTALFWSHHDKVIVVDFRLAFVGGIDLAYGRWDDGNKVLVDEEGVKFPGDDYYNPGSGLHMPVRPIFAPMPVTQASVVPLANSPPLALVTAISSPGKQNGGDAIFLEGDGHEDDDGEDDDVSKNSDDGGDEDDAEVKESKKSRRTDLTEETVAERELREGEEKTVHVETLRHISGIGRMKKMTSQFFGGERNVSDDNDSKSPPDADDAVAQASGLDNVMESAYQKAFAGTDSKDNNLQALPNFFRHPLRLTHSRMPWHDVHLCMTGPAARDVGLHFSQRWNHHRIAKGDIKMPIIVNPTDDPQFGVCAKCRCKTFEWDDNCVCGNNLGPVSPQFSVLKKLALATGRGDTEPKTVLSFFANKDLNVSRYECFEFEVTFEDRLGIRIVGDGPSVVFSKLETNVVHTNGIVKTTSCVSSDRAESLFCKYRDVTVALVPEVGDTIVAINDFVVEHLPFQDVQRIVKRAQGDPVLLGVVTEEYVDENAKKPPSSFVQNIARTFSSVPDSSLAVKSFDADVRTVSSDDTKVIPQASVQKSPLRVKFRRFLRLHEEALIRLADSALEKVNEVPGLEESNNPEPTSNEAAAVEIMTQAIGFVPRIIRHNSDDTISQSHIHLNQILYSQQALLHSDDIMLNVGLSEPIQEIKEPNGTVKADLQVLGDEVLRMVAPTIDVATKLVEAAISMNVLRNMTNLASSKTASSLMPDQVPFSGTCEVQVLRSLGEWSGGIRVAEDSIHNAYCSLIESAEHYIYIENQFFISNTYGKAVRNRIGECIFRRIMSAIERKQSFRVIIVLPLHPEGDFLHAAAVSAVMHYQYHSICRGPNSLLKRLQREAPDADLKNYLCFFSLCANGELMDKSICEQVYVHDKLMIVDDKSVILGSANINDRSMCGDRDSEIAVLIRDSRTIDSVMNGAPYKAGYLPHKLRTALWRQHVGSANANVDDVISDVVYWDILHTTAQANEQVLEEQNGLNFNAKTFAEFNRLRVLRERKDIMSGRSLSGNLVYFPLNFLSDENLSPDNSEAAILPEHLWT